MSVLKWIAIPLTMGCQSTDLDECNGGNCDSLDTGMAPDETAFKRVAWDCCDPTLNDTCGDVSGFWFDIILNGKPAEMELDFSFTNEQGQPTYQETHTVPSVYEDSSGFWSNHFVELVSLDSSNCMDLASCDVPYESGISTVFSCDSDMLGHVNWTLRVQVIDTVEAGICGTWGAELDGTDNCKQLIPEP